MIINIPEFVKEYLKLIENGVSKKLASEIVGRDVSCTRRWIQKINQKDVVEPVHKVAPRILLLDIETSPILSYYFGKRYDVNINQAGIVHESFILSAAWKFLGESEVHSITLNDTDDIFSHNDKKILEKLSEVINKSDIIIAHNGVKFDIPIIKTRMLYHNLVPLKHIHIEDTLKIARSNFKFPSNRLDDLGIYLGVGKKLSHEGMSLWIKFLQGDKEAIQNMVDYNVQDVILLEQIYLKLRSWNKNGKILGSYYEDNKQHCPCCGSTNVKETGECVYTTVGKYIEMVCKDCRKRSKLSQNTNPKDKSKNILRN